MKFSLRLLYLYLFSFVGLITTIIGSIQILDLGLRTYVFRVNERTYYAEPVMEGKTTLSAEEMDRRNQEEQSSQRKRQLSNSIALNLVGAPVYLYHWKTIKKESRT